jgi:hypothetical protein
MEMPDLKEVICTYGSLDVKGITYYIATWGSPRASQEAGGWGQAMWVTVFSVFSVGRVRQAAG